MVMPPETGKRTAPGQMELVAAILMGGLGITQVVAMPLLATLIASAFQIEGADRRCGTDRSRSYDGLHRHHPA